MGPPPRVPLVLLLLLAAERTAHGTFPEEPGPIAVAPEDCECPPGVGGGCWVGVRVLHQMCKEGRGSAWREDGVLGCFGGKAEGGHPWGGVLGVLWGSWGGWGCPGSV